MDLACTSSAGAGDGGRSTALSPEQLQQAELCVGFPGGKCQLVQAVRIPVKETLVGGGGERQVARAWKAFRLRRYKAAGTRSSRRLSPPCCARKSWSHRVYAQVKRV